MSNHKSMVEDIPRTCKPIDKETSGAQTLCHFRRNGLMHMPSIVRKNVNGFYMYIRLHPTLIFLFLWTQRNLLAVRPNGSITKKAIRLHADVRYVMDDHYFCIEKSVLHGNRMESSLKNQQYVVLYFDFVATGMSIVFSLLVFCVLAVLFLFFCFDMCRNR